MTNKIGASLPLIYSGAAANYSGNTKKVTINAVSLISFYLSNNIGPLTFTDATALVYIPAKMAIMATGLVAIAATLLLWWRYRHKSAKRDRDGDTGVHLLDSEFMDLMDRQNREFRYAV